MIRGDMIEGLVRASIARKQFLPLNDERALFDRPHQFLHRFKRDRVMPRPPDELRARLRDVSGERGGDDFLRAQIGNDLFLIIHFHSDGSQI
jgi:hypothetical protein